jgi:hypothetical protein
VTTEPSDFQPEIRRARFQRLTIYELSETELDTLEKGSPDSIYLNISIALLSVAVSLTVTLVTATLSHAAFTVFVVLVAVGYVVGVVLLLLWHNSRRSVVTCARTIRDRLPPTGVAQPLDSQPPTDGP